MDAKNETLSLSDYGKIIARKFFRLAMPFYLIWFMLWCLQSRVINGPLWQNTDIIFGECDKYWWTTALWIGNLYPGEMAPYKGCLQ